MKPRLTILGLMAFVLLVAVGFAALRNADAVWASTQFTLTLAVLCTATVVAFYRRGAWAGFAVFAWAHLLACLGQADTGPGLLTVTVAYRLYPLLNDAQPTSGIVS